MNSNRLVVLAPIGYFYLWCEIAHATNTASECKDVDTLTLIIDELSAFREQNTRQKTWMLTQEAIIKDITTQLNVHKDVVQSLSTKLSEQEKVIQNLTVKVNEKEVPNQSLVSNPEVRDHHQGLGCITNTIDLTCSNGGLITITRAYYGQYRQTSCSNECCAPNPENDCKELVEENDPAEWVYLKYLCDNKTECSYVYNGAFINDCEMGYAADYMLIYYSCQPYNESDYAAFTARATGSRTYNQYDIVLFDSPITNTGNHYNTHTSNFVCPFHGIYSFSVSFYAGLYSELYLDFMQGNLFIIRGFVDESSLVANAVHTVVIECDAGQVVWVRCGSNNGDILGDEIQSHFTGFLLHRLSELY